MRPRRPPNTGSGPVSDRREPATAAGGSPRLDARPTGRAGALPARAQATQPLDQQRVDGQRLGLVDQSVEHLVVPRGRHVEQFADGLLLGARVLPPLSLEREDLALATVELAGRPVDGGQAPGFGGGLHRAPRATAYCVYCRVRWVYCRVRWVSCGGCTAACFGCTTACFARMTRVSFARALNHGAPTETGATRHRYRSGDGCAGSWRAWPSVPYAS